MQPAVRDLTMYQGDPYEHVVTFVDKEQNPLDLSGTWKSDIRDTVSSEEPLVSFTINSDDAINGTLVLSLTSEQTLVLPIDCIWDLELLGTGTYLKGKIRVERQVTR